MLKHKYGDLNYISDQQSAIHQELGSLSITLIWSKTQTTVSPERQHSRPPPKYYFIFHQTTNHICLDQFLMVAKKKNIHINAPLVAKTSKQEQPLGTGGLRDSS